VLALVAVATAPSTRQYIHHGRWLGPLALGGAALATVGVSVANFLLRGRAAALGALGSLLIDIYYLFIMVLGFLCLWNFSRVQILMGATALAGLVLLPILSRLDVFISIWLNSTLFWPFVILGTLVFEAAVLRVVRPATLRSLVAD